MSIQPDPNQETDGIQTDEVRTLDRLMPLLRGIKKVDSSRRVTPENELVRDLGFDSTDFIELVFEVEDTFGFDITDADLFSEWKTVQLVVDYIDRRRTKE